MSSSLDLLSFEGKDVVVIEGEQGDSLGDNWLACMRSRQKPV